MDLGNTQTGWITRIDPKLEHTTINYTVTLLNETETSVKVRFDFADGRRFETVMKKSRVVS